MQSVLPLSVPMRFNRKTFFDGYRKLYGPLDQKQVDGLELLLGKMETDPNWVNIPQIAYALATVKHESANTFQPIKEYRAKLGSKARLLQDKYWSTGYYGRGYVQITHKRNYQTFGIADDPDKALEPETAYRILSDGMKDGDFTGRKLGDFISDGWTDYINARTVINGHDKAAEIAKAARNLEAVLRTASQAKEPAKEPEVEPDKKPEPPPQEPQPPAAPQAPKPDVLPVAPPKGSIVTKIAAAASALGPVMGATGLKLGGIEFKTGGLIAFAAILIAGMICATIIYNKDRERRHAELLASMNNLADANKANVIAAGSKV